LREERFVRPDRSPNSAYQPVAPHSVEAEQAVLGAILIDNTAFARIASRLAPEDFYRPDHRAIYSAIVALAKEGKPSDAITVSEQLQRGRALETAGGLSYLGSLAQNTPTASNIEAYADVVRERSTLRGLRELSRTMAHNAIEPGGMTPAELVASASESLANLRARSRLGKGLIATRDLAGELIDDLDRRREGLRGLALGLSDFDELTCGLEPGDLVVVAGRPGMGKTALLVSVACHVAASTGVAVFSAEMPAQQLMRRCVALLSSVPQGRLRRAERLTDADWAALTPATADLAERRIWIDDTALPQLAHIRAETTALKARERLGLVIVDYVQLVHGRGANRYEQLRDVAYGMKALAKDLGIPVIVLAQLNRGVEGRDQKRPQLSDLRDSGAIEEAADIVGLLYSEGYYDRSFEMPYVLECQVQKNRNGERGECLWRFAGEFSRVTVLESDGRDQYRRQRASQHGRASNDF
jgi:replicative DNA helicase